MAYADADTGSRTLSAGAAVLALEAALVWALVTGLAYQRLTQREIHTGDFPIPAPFPTMPLPPECPAVREPVAVPTPFLTVTPSDPGRVQPADPVTEPTGGTATAPQTAPTPVPPPSPKPPYAPRSARPKGDSAGWLTADDYPIRAIRERQESRTGYRLTIDTSGRVTACAITVSSGHAALDARACLLLPKRARFEPARDDGGAAVTGSYSGTIQWRLPPED